MRRDLWEVTESAFLPAPLAVVSKVFPLIKEKVDLKRYATSVTRTTGLRFPDPVMLAVVQSSDSMRRYFANWLAIRTAWIQHVIAHPSAESPTSKEWRAFLLSMPADRNCEKTTASAQERSRALKLFHEVLPVDASGISWAGDTSVTFRNDTVKVFKSISPAQACVITWELCELHFQFDLLAMDQALVPTKWKESPAEREAIWHAIFPEKTLGDAWDAPLPITDNGVMRTSDLHDKFSMLNALARLLSAWPGAPQLFHAPIAPSLSNEQVQGAMADLMGFYVKSFYQQNGRPPICPRHLPVA